MNNPWCIFLALIALPFVLVVGCGDDDDDDNDDSAPADDDDDAVGDDDDDNDDDDTASDYPPGLPFEYTRQDNSEPISEQEMTEFSEKMRDFYQDSSFVDWLLRTSHGIDDSTGMKDYRLWMEDVQGEKNGDTVTIAHRYYDEHGGHNILKGNSLLLGSAIGGYLRTKDPVLGELTRLFCAGISSTMLGMVYDEFDPILHLMARNVVTSNHTYTTHDGRKKFVDYSNWFHPYDRWNCSRFKYENNPYWGEVWVTNTRSKDGVGYLYKTAVPVYHAATYAADSEVRDACGETWDLLTAFAGDIVDNDYLIRSKDKAGNPYRPGVDPEPEEADIGDLSSFTAWDPLLPDAECNAVQATALLGYGERLGNDCDPFGGNRIYEIGAILNNPPNGHIMRSFHISNIALALHREDNDAALKSMGGLEQRFKRDVNLDLSSVSTSEDGWYKDIAINYLQAASAGYYLTYDEIREIHKYALRAIEQYSQWENWDLWAETIPEGEELKVIPPAYETLPDESREYWFQTYAVSMFMEYCWGLYRNPDSPEVIDCDIFQF
jgi:hypothetical protein